MEKFNRRTKKIPIGIDNFSELISPNSRFLFIDKSLMIKELIESGVKLSLILRPRRWGKTLSMSMLQHFFSPKVNTYSTKGLFSNLNIASVQEGYFLKKYQGNYPVIFVSFKNIKEKTYQEFLNRMTNVVQNVCKNFPELTNSSKLMDVERNDLEKLKGINKDNKINEVELQEFLRTISNLLYKHYDKKVIILIDEYDTPLNAAYGQPYFAELINFFENMFGAALKSNDALEFGFMTGVLKLSKNHMLSDLNNLKSYSLIEEQYSQSFGFSEQEMIDLLEENNINLDLKEISRWYGGYKYGSLENIYNPWSILNCIYEKGKFQPYWVKTGEEELLKIALLNSRELVKEKLNKLLAGSYIESVINEYLSFEQIKDVNEEVIWSLLWSMGYLKSIGEPILSGSHYMHQLAIPNYEIECIYRDMLKEF